MALLKWGEDEEKKDDQFESPIAKTIQSVQSGWQPTQDTASEGEDSQNGSYLLSEQKAQIDHEQQQQRAVEEANRARAAAEAADAQNRAAAAQEAQIVEQPQQQATPKYAGGQKKNEGGLLGFAKNVGAGIQQGLGALGDIAIEGGGLIGSFGKNDKQLVQHMAEVEKVRGWLHSKKDINGNNFVGTQDVDQNAANIATGRGTTQDYLAVGGKGLQAGIDATMFVNPAALAAKSAVTPIVSQTARLLANPAVRTAARDAVFYGGTQGVATTAQQYGETGSLEEALKAGATDAAIGGVTQGVFDMGGHAIGHGIQKLTPVIDRAVDNMRTVEPVPAVDIPAEQPQRAADGIAQPAQDSNLSFDNRAADSQTPIEIPAFENIAPIADSYTPASPNLPPVAGNLVPEPVQTSPIGMPQQPAPDAPMSLDELSSRANLDNVTPATNVPTAPVAPTPVADGAVMPTANMPTVKSEEVRQLQDSRAGASQAEEAQINQKLQQAKTPEASSYDAQLNELDAALERGDISYDEHARLEDELFARENQAGRAMAQDAPKSDETKWLAATKEQGTMRPNMNESPITQARREMKAQGISPVTKDGRNAIIDRKNELIPSSMDDMPTKKLTPVKTDSVPDGMGATETPGAPKKAAKAETYLQRTVSSDASSLDAKRALTSVSDVKDKENLDEIIDNIPKITPKIKERLHSDYATIDAAEKRINQIQGQFRKDAGKDGGGNMPLDKAQELAHERNKLVQDMQIAEKNMQSTVRRLESRQSLKSRALNAAANLTSYSQGNMLASLPVQEKNVIGDIISSVTTAVQHPIKMATNIPEARLASEFKRAVREVAQVTPQTLSEVPKYLIRSALSPVYAINNSLANVRGGMYRNELAKTELIKSGIKNPTAEQIKLQAMRAGNAREIIVNLNKGVGSAMSDPYKAASAADEYFKVLDTAKSHSELAKFAEETRQSTEILQGMMSGGKTDGKVTPMSLLINNIYPFVNPAVNSFKKAIYQLDPRKASQMNEIRKTIQSPTRQNIAKLTKIAGTAASVVAIVSLLDDETIAYNDGDSDVSRPRGWSVKTGENTYMPVRAFGVFEPFIVGTGVTYEVMNGNVKNPKDALKMAASSLPYLSSNEFYGQAVDEMAEGNMWGYGTQSQAVARTKNLVPLVNNGLDRWTDRNNGESTDANSAYVSKKNAEGKSVPDFLPWLDNSVGAGFGMENGITGTQKGMKGSYTPAGQLRTADNQGAFVNKTINDKNTATHNKTIIDLVEYGRENKLGADAKEMFNTYDTGKNNRFKLVQDTITFLDVPEGSSPDNADKLKNNAKLGVLAAQIRDGFYGDTGNDLLTLDGKEVYSNASVPNKSGTKNSRLPLNMQTIKNAVAATDLPEKDRDRMYEISQANQALYDRRKNKEITYDQEQAMKAANEQEYVQILSASPSYKKLVGLMDTLKGKGFFNEGGIGSTKSGQTYLWNSLNALLGSKGATPAANYPESGKGFTPWGRGGGGGSRNTAKNGKTGTDGVKWTPAGKRQMAKVSSGKYTPVQIKVKLGNEVKKNKTQNYSDRSF
jgi:hypothetical protein